jgi:hypothetical protein
MRRNRVAVANCVIVQNKYHGSEESRLSSVPEEQLCKFKEECVVTTVNRINNRQ